MGNKNSIVTQQQLDNLQGDIKKQLDNFQDDIEKQLKLTVDCENVKPIVNESLIQKIDKNHDKILEQQMKMLTNMNKTTEIKEEAFKKYCALSFEQQLYSIIKYGLKDINEKTIIVQQIKLTVNDIEIQYKEENVNKLVMQQNPFNINPCITNWHTYHIYIGLPIVIQSNSELTQWENHEYMIAQVLNNQLVRLKMARLGGHLRIDWNTYTIICDCKPEMLKRY